MRAQSLFFIGLSFWAFSLSSCDNKPANASPGSAAVVTVKPKPAPVILNEEQRKVLTTAAEGWAKSISDGKAEEMLKVFKVEDLVRDAFVGVELDPEMRSGMEVGALRAVKTARTTMGQQLTGQGKFLRILDAESGTVARMRIVSDSGIFYLDLVPIMEKDGQVSIKDLNNLSMGISVGESMKQMMTILAASKPKQQGILAKMLGVNDATEVESKRIWDYIMAFKENKARAVEIYPTLPLSLRQNRAFFGSYLQSAMSLNDEAIYMKALEAGRQQFPNDPALTFMMVDYHYMKKDFDATGQSIMATMKNLGEDGSLWNLMASMRRESGELDLADEAYQKSIGLEPDVLNHHLLGIQISAQRKDYKQMVDRLHAANKGLNDAIILNPIGEAFFDDALKTEEYQAYAAQLPK